MTPKKSMSLYFLWGDHSWVALDVEESKPLKTFHQGHSSKEILFAKIEKRLTLLTKYAPNNSNFSMSHPLLSFTEYWGIMRMAVFAHMTILQRIIFFQKLAPEVFYKKGIFKNFCKIHRKTSPCGSWYFPSPFQRRCCSST